MGETIRDLSELLTSGKLGFKLFLQLMALLIPHLAIYAIPFAVLSGILIGLGRMCADEEITAMKASGFSLYQIASSVFLIAFLGMVISAAFSLYYGPKSTLTYRSLIAQSLSENPIGFIQEKKFVKDFPGYVIYVNDREGKELKDFWVWELNEAEEVQLFVRAQSGELDYDKNKRSLLLNLQNGSIEGRTTLDTSSINANSPKILYFQSLPIVLPLNALFENLSTGSVRYKDMTFPQLMDERKVLREKEEGSDGIISEERKHLQLYIHENLSQAYSVFALSLVAIPLAIRVGRKESLINVLIALLIALLYHLLTVFMSWFDGVEGIRSDLLIWIPNILFQFLGIWLFSKAARK
jgi:lipopolysaccharide export system permease protein